jgi:hypothetical protein
MVRETRPERNPRAQVEAVVKSLLEALAAQQRLEILGLLGDAL